MFQLRKIINLLIMLLVFFDCIFALKERTNVASNLASKTNQDKNSASIGSTTGGTTASIGSKTASIGSTTGGTTASIGSTTGGTTASIGSTTGGTTASIGSTTVGTTASIGSTTVGTTASIGSTTVGTTASIGSTTASIGSTTASIGSTTASIGSTTGGTIASIGSTTGGTTASIGSRATHLISTNNGSASTPASPITNSGSVNATNYFIPSKYYNDSLPNCFYDTADKMIARLNTNIDYYNNLCSLSGKNNLQRLITVSGIISDLDGYANKKYTNLPQRSKDMINTLDSYSDFKFSSTLSQIKIGYNSNLDITSFIKTVWLNIGDELDQIISTNNYPFFYRTNIWNLIQMIKIVNILKLEYAANYTVCIKNDWEGILQINDLTNDQNHNKIFRLTGGTLSNDANDIQITPSLFSNGGIALTLWSFENALDLNKTENVLSGYIFNNKVYEYNLVPRNGKVVHQFTVFNVIYF